MRWLKLKEKELDKGYGVTQILVIESKSMRYGIDFAKSKLTAEDSGLQGMWNNSMKVQWFPYLMLIFASSLRLSLSLICVVIAELNIDDVNKYNKYTYFENSLFDWRGKSEYMFNCPFMCPDYCAQNLLILSCHETCNCKTQQPQTAQGITDISTNITRKSTDYRVLKDNINHQFLNQESSYEICLSECSDFCRGIESSPGTCMNLCIEELCPTQKSHTNTLNDWSFTFMFLVILIVASGIYKSIIRLKRAIYRRQQDHAYRYQRL